MDFKNELALLRPDLGSNVGALFTERSGGVSSGPWGTVSWGSMSAAASPTTLPACA